MEQIFGHRKNHTLHHNADNCSSFSPWYCEGCTYGAKKVCTIKKVTINRSRTYTDRPIFEMRVNVSMQHCQNQDPPMNLFQTACSTFAVLERDFDDGIVSQTSYLDIYVVSCLHTSKRLH